MLQQVEKSAAKWGGKSKAVDNWLLERQDLIKAYCNLAGLNDQGESLPEANLITTFCEILVDYLSAGHFEVFDMLVGNNTQAQQLRENLESALVKTTDEALLFNDTFVDSVTTEQAAKFDNALALLGETLEERFALEDRLIACMHDHA